MTTQDKLRPEELDVVRMADQVAGVLSQSSQWAERYLKDDQIRKFMQKVIQEKQISVQRIGESARRPLALGIFGASQCGKSYLVSELVRGGSSALTVFLNKPQQKPALRDYLEEINPAGGRESTAIVTRFTIRPYREIPGCSAYLRLLSATDILKILLNGFLFECQSDFLPGAEELQKMRSSFRSVSRKSQGDALLTETDVWDLQDYARRHFHTPYLKMLEDMNYWGILNEEIRFLPSDQQIIYLSWLWGKFPKMTELFRTLQNALGPLGGEVVGISDDALVPRENSIIDVQRLSQLMKVGNRKCSVIRENGASFSLDSSVLCALGAELILNVQSSQGDSLLQTMDVLDFPGARARAQMFDMHRIESDQSALVEMFLRGKVAYLFDRYSDDRDVSGLILCQEGGPQEAKSLPYMINKWVEWSQGKDAKARSGKAPLLFNVFTKFDIDLIRKKGEDPRVRWDSRLKTNFADFFGRVGDWVEDWGGGKPFQNCFWVRNPNVQQTIFGRDQQGKEFVRDEAQLAEIKGQYLANSMVQKHFGDPEGAWNRAATAENAGITFLVECLKKSVEPSTKVKQLRENIELMLAELKTHLQPYFVGEDIPKARSLAEERAKKRLVSLGQKMATHYSIAQMLDRDRFSISDKTIGMIFDAVVNPMDSLENSEGGSGSSPVEKQVFEESIFQVVESPTAATAEPVQKKTPPRKGEVFAEAVLNRWQEQLVHLSKDEDFHQKIGLNGEWLAEVTQEIIKGASRGKLQDRIAAESDTYLNAPNSTRFLRKTSVRVASILNSFVLELGQPRPEKPIPAGPPTATLSARAYPGLALYLHWTKALLLLFKDNVAEATADDDASNAALGEILKTAV
ncbi:MAG: virulence factor SrfC family protein [Candidatus Ozemobacteraceae bacterium]